MFAFIGGGERVVRGQDGQRVAAGEGDRAGVGGGDVIIRVFRDRRNVCRDADGRGARIQVHDKFAGGRWRDQHGAGEPRDTDADCVGGLNPLAQRRLVERHAEGVHARVGRRERVSRG